MLKYTKVLVATNLSQNTGKLIVKAKEFADDPENIILLHVVPPIDVNLYGAIPYLAIFPIVDKDKLEKQIFQYKNESINAIALEFDLDREQCLIETGNPKERIIEFSKRNECDLIVIANHEQVKLGPYLGSTTKRILQNAHCDVLIIK